jgi:hypothetical protein
MSSDAGLFPQDNDFFSHLYDDYAYDDWEEDESHHDMVVYEDVYYGDHGAYSIHPKTVIVLAVIVGVVLAALAGRITFASDVQEEPTETVETAVTTQVNQSKTADVQISSDALTFAAPYTDYSITQGVHGLSYGHMAIDIAAGRGEPILAPINGEVTQLYIDEYGNTTLVIENDAYQVTFLHGDYAVAVGDKLKIGQQLGTEGNNGYTKDMAGNLCYNRVWCGNHTHLNVFDKQIQANVNPLTLFGG